MKVIRHILPLMLLTLLLTSSCERRDLWLYERDLNQVRLVVDWSLFREAPTGMTVTFYPQDGSAPTTVATANIYSTDLTLDAGVYDVVLFNQLASEYSNQAFRGMNKFTSSAVYVHPLINQPAKNAYLFDPTRPIYEEPELMATDTLLNLVISKASASDSLIRYEDRDKYKGGKETTQVVNMRPIEIVYKLNIRVYVQGIHNMYSVKGCIDGMAAGYELGRSRRTSDYVQYYLNSWTATSPSATSAQGYIATSLKTFGLVRRSALKDDDVKLHLYFLLADRKNTRDFHFDVANIITKAIDEADLRQLNADRSMELSISPDGTMLRELELDLHIEADMNHPLLPDVEHADPTESGFEADVDDWEQVEIDVPI